MASGDVIRLENVGDTDFVDAFNGRKYVIPAHGQLMVDYDCVCLWLGHPEANNFDPRNRVRVQEYERLRVRYGISAKALEMSTDKQPFEDDDLFRSMRPKLEAYQMSGDRLITVADDPDGDLLQTPPDSKLSDIGVLTARLHAMEQEQANLKKQLAMQQRADQARNEAQPIGEDFNPSTTTAADIAGTVTVSEPDQAPPDPERTVPGEDTPTRLRVTNT